MFYSHNRFFIGIQFFASDSNIDENDSVDNSDAFESETRNIEMEESFSDDKNLEFDETILQTKEKNTNKKIISNIFDMIEVFCYAIALMVIVFLFVIKFVTVDGSSMNNTLKDKDRLIIYNLFYEPETNDIIVINRGSDADSLLVKRVIGVSGDTVKIDFDTWEIWVNEKLIDQSYLDSNPQKGIMEMKKGELTNVDENNCVTFVVEEGKVFVMGDNRNASLDSRSLGQLDIDRILGKVILRVSPFDKAGVVK